MKKLLMAGILLTAMYACNDASETTQDAKDSLDSVAREQKDRIDSAADQRIDRIDSITEQKKDNLDRIDSINDRNTGDTSRR